MYKSVYDPKGFETVANYTSDSYRALDYRKAEEAKFSKILNLTEDEYLIEKELRKLSLMVFHLRKIAHDLANHNTSFTNAQKYVTKGLFVFCGFLIIVGFVNDTLHLGIKHDTITYIGAILLFTVGGGVFFLLSLLEELTKGHKMRADLRDAHHQLELYLNCHISANLLYNLCAEQDLHSDTIQDAETIRLKTQLCFDRLTNSASSFLKETDYELYSKLASGMALGSNLDAYRKENGNISVENKKTKTRRDFSLKEIFKFTSLISLIGLIAWFTLQYFY